MSLRLKIQQHPVNKYLQYSVFLNWIPDVELYHGHGGQNQTSVEHSSATKLSDVTLGIWNWFGNSYLFFLHKLFWPKLWSWSLDQENDGDGGWSQKKSWRSSVRGNKQWLHCRKWQFLIALWFISGLVDLKNQLLLISFFSSSFFDVSYCYS